MEYSKDMIIKIIDEEIHNIVENRNKYIELNGDKHVDTLNRFTSGITTLYHLLTRFE